jgi:hypothetical protein
VPLLFLKEVHLVLSPLNVESPSLSNFNGYSPVLFI